MAKTVQNIFWSLEKRNYTRKHIRKLSFNVKEHKAKITHSTCSINSTFKKGFAKRTCPFISRQLHTVDKPSSASEIQKNAAKETQNNEVELQKSKDRKVHYTIGQLLQPIEIRDFRSTTRVQNHKKSMPSRRMSNILTYQVRVTLATSDVQLRELQKYRQLMRSTWRIETMVLPELSRTMAYTTRNTVNRLALNELNLNSVVLERSKEE